MALVLGSSLLAACTHSPKTSDARVAATSEEAALIAAAETRARARLRTFALEPPRPVLVDIAPTRAAFEDATGVHDDLVRAWTVFDIVTLAPLSTWSDASPAAVESRLTHELCHAAIEQRFGDIERARAARIPRFFEEGTCSVVAEQGPLREPLDAVRRRAGAPGALDARTFTNDAVLAYSAAHHLMSDARARFGDRVFAEVADEAARDGAPGCVERALERRLGASIDEAWRTLLAPSEPSS